MTDISTLIERVKAGFRALPDGPRPSPSGRAASVSAVPASVANAGVTLDTIGGNCPVQAEGTVDGHSFYFRARGDGWDFWVGEPWTAEAFLMDGPYGKWPAAGWMPEAVALHLIAAGCEAFRDLGFREPARGMEARQGGGEDAVNDSPVGEADAPNPSVETDHAE